MKDTKIFFAGDIELCTGICLGDAHTDARTHTYDKKHESQVTAKDRKEEEGRRKRTIHHHLLNNNKNKSAENRNINLCCV